MRREFYRLPTPEEEEPDDDVRRGREAVEHARRLLRADTAAGHRARVGLAVLGGIGALAAVAPVISAVQEQPQVPAPELAPAPTAAAQQTSHPMLAELARGEERLQALAHAVASVEKTVSGARPVAELEKAKSAVEALKKDTAAAVGATGELTAAIEQLGDEDLSRRGHAARDQAGALAERAAKAWTNHEQAVRRSRQEQRAVQEKAAATTAHRAIRAAEDGVRTAIRSLAVVRMGLRERTPALQLEPGLTAAEQAVDEARSLASQAKQVVTPNTRSKVATIETAVEGARRELGELRAALDQAHEAERLQRGQAASRTAAEAVRLAQQAADLAATSVRAAGTADTPAATHTAATALTQLATAHERHRAAEQTLRAIEPEAQLIAEHTAVGERLATLDRELWAATTALAQRPAQVPAAAPQPASPVPARASAATTGVSVQLPGGRGVVQAPNAKAAIAIRAVLGQLGVPYVWGGRTPGRGFDCSGLTSWAYSRAGVTLPRVSRSQTVGARVSQNELQPGDLVVWAGHVAMYLGKNLMVEAGDPVQISRLRITNLKMRFLGFYRPTA